MKTRTWLGLAAAMALALPGGLTAQRPGGAGSDPQRRTLLEQRIRQQFVQMVDRQLRLDTGQRTRIRGLLRDGVEERRTLALESQRLRLDLIEAVRNEDTPTSMFQSILERFDRLRERERSLERDEEAELDEFLDPRQKATFLLLRMRFNDRVREVLDRRGPGGVDGGGQDRPF
jgi:hypothetical protein